ncbi:hypothetical protein [Chitinophaga barathri]|uniref:Uncharacterized protein n=1 Tax=Chitinophaga barathri TaxID=1647451 RepID=A0A3N4MD25_9BACT|nr:hypothetical protein [Chitinophaga barathri]RPD39457.1 hypothetical protein EG028_20265 [Chitinophaga barathri]
MRSIISAVDITASSCIQDFFESYPDPDAAKKVLWELLVAATGSQHADIWNGETRAKMLFFYEQCGDFF